MSQQQYHDDTYMPQQQNALQNQQVTAAGFDPSKKRHEKKRPVDCGDCGMEPIEWRWPEAPNPNFGKT